MGNHSAAWDVCKKYKEKLKEVTQAINVKSYAEAVKSGMSYMNERLRTESSWIKNNFFENKAIYWHACKCCRNFDKLALYKEYSHLRDKISILTLTFCKFQKNHGY